MTFLLANQLTLMLAAFAAGLVGWLLVLAKPAGSRAWKLADFLWVIFGGFGTLAAVVAGLYRADTSRIDRQIDLAYTSMRAFDRDAARFRLRYCEGADGAIHVLCDKVEFLSAATAINGRLPLFLDITRAAMPLQSLRLFSGRDSGTGDMMAMMRQADGFDPGSILSFATTDPQITAALQDLHHDAAGTAIAADYQVLASSFDDLTGQARRLKEEWDYLRAHSQFLAVQVLALCLVAFAAPFRIGKSLADLR